MAEFRAALFGSELDKVFCAFYLKTGACAYGKSCNRVHPPPPESQTILLKHLYINPRHVRHENGELMIEGNKKVSELEVQHHYDNIYEDIFVECEHKYGKIVRMCILDNICEHLFGNIFIQFRNERDATRAHTKLNNRWFGGKPIHAELSPVENFYNAKCKLYETTGDCHKQGYCNFWHVKPISKQLDKFLFPSSQRSRYNNNCWSLTPPRRPISSSLRRSRSESQKRRRSRSRSTVPGRSSTNSNRRRSRTSSRSRSRSVHRERNMRSRPSSRKGGDDEAEKSPPVSN